MKLLTILSRFAGLLSRLLDRLEQYDQERKQLRREERRAAVSDNPDQAFADLFGESDGVRKSAGAAGVVRPDAAKTAVEPDR